MDDQTNDPQNPKITILGKEYMFKDLPEDVQKMVTLYNAWNVELVKQQTETMKLELAIRGVTQDIMKAMTETTGEAVKLETTKPISVVDADPKYLGTVEWYNDAKGYGFIKPDDGSESIYVHFSQILTGSSAFKTLREGQRVSFYTQTNHKGKQAVSVSEL